MAEANPPIPAPITAALLFIRLQYISFSGWLELA
jgi:hypothetical protein